MVMGTASTMTSIAEVLGLTLPGAASIPAADSNHARMLVLTTAESGLASVAETRAWQEKVPHSELVVLPGDSFHVAATDPGLCAEALLDFLARHEGGFALRRIERDQQVHRRIHDRQNARVVARIVAVEKLQIFDRLAQRRIIKIMHGCAGRPRNGKKRCAGKNIDPRT